MLLLLEELILSGVTTASDISEAIDVESIGPAEVIDAEEGQTSAEGEKVDDEDDEPKEVPPVPRLVQGGPGRRSGRRVASVTDVAPFVLRGIRSMNRAARKEKREK